MKLNLGSAHKRFEGFTNIDKFDIFNPDILHDLELFPYPIEDNSVDEIKMHHILEHIGRDPDIYNKVFKEIYRISSNDAKIDIIVPHPRHDLYLADPTHVRPITRLGLELFDKDLNERWKQSGVANSQLALIHNVNFKIIDVIVTLEKKYHDLLQTKQISNSELQDYISKYNNVVIETNFILKVIK
tara:strand:- start:740 stop:1297 length:558 start_codon:yes stop_codon:yes gene_type:complete